MAAVARPGALQRARTALRGADFRKLFAIRIVGQGGDGFFTVALSDWRVWCAVIVLALLAYVVWERNGKPDIRGLVR